MTHSFRNGFAEDWDRLGTFRRGPEQERAWGPGADWERRGPGPEWERRGPVPEWDRHGPGAAFERREPEPEWVRQAQGSEPEWVRQGRRGPEPHQREAPVSTKDVAAASTKDVADNDFTIGDLEALLKAAIDSENYALAASLRDQIHSLEIDSSACVKEANDQFYQAWRSSDMKKMSEVWGKGSHVRCAHPGMKCVSSSEAVLKDWNKIFTEFEDIDVTPVEVQVHARRDWGIVTCVEKVVTGKDIRRVTATNVFEKENGRWVLVHHQACPAQTCAAPP